MRLILFIIKFACSLAQFVVCRIYPELKLIKIEGVFKQVVCVDSFDLAFTILFWEFLEFLITPIILTKDLFRHSCILKPISTSGLLSAGPSDLTTVNTVEVIIKPLLYSLKITKSEITIEELIVLL